MSVAAKRVMREFKEANCSEELAKCAIKLELRNNAWLELRGEISGPPGTPYEGGAFLVDITVPDSYPFEPPKVKFITKIWHPNISSVTGAVCLDILKDQWAAAMTLRTMLLSLQALLSAPEPNDPQDGVVAKQFLENAALFEQTAKQWAHEYAGGPHGDPFFEEQLRKFAEMGVDRCRACVALSSTDWDLDAAVKFLFS